MSTTEPDFLDDEDEAKPIVQWFDDSPWKVQFVPTAVAFGAGCLVGAVTALGVVKYLRD